MIKTSLGIASRSVRFQLTSLMDLLLIIVFAQYLEFHRGSEAAREVTRQEISQARDAAQKQLALETAKLNVLRDELIRDNTELRHQKEDAALVAAEANKRQAFTEDLLKKLLQVDPDVVNAELSPPGSAAAVEDAAAIAESIRDADGTRILRFLAGYDELLKRAEIWTLHVSDRGDTELDSGSGQSHSFRLEASTQLARSLEFIQQMRTVYSQVPQPKGLVVILVSYSPRAVAGNYQPVVDGMPQLIEWLGKDSAGRTRFEYSVIGAITDPRRDLPVAPSTP